MAGSAPVSTAQMSTTHGEGPGRGAARGLCHPAPAAEVASQGEAEHVARLWLFIFLNKTWA